MIIVKVELHSAVTGRITELARMRIANTGQSMNPNVGDYEGVTYRGRSREALDEAIPNRKAEVLKHRRLELHVWHLVAKMLSALGYGI